MNEDDLKKLLKQNQHQPINTQAKQRAISAALDEFDALQAEKTAPATTTKKAAKFFQGIFYWLRLTSRSQTDDRRKDMMYAQQKWVLGGIATACVAVFGVMVSINNPVLKAPSEPFTARPDELTLGDKSADESRLVIAESEDGAEQVMVTGIREPLEKSKDIQRDSAGIVDSISAQDIGQLPDSHLAESLQRVTGVEMKKEARPARMYAPPSGALPATVAQADSVAPQNYQETGRDRFEQFETNPIKLTSEEPVSTFSIDVDTASYSFVRRQLNNGVLPQKAAVRLEELVNYFDYDYPLPKNKSQPFQPTVTVLPSPWHKEKKLIHIGIKGYDISEQPKSNLVFLLDVSGSMSSPDKLPLVKQSMSLLLSKLRADDTVAIAVYAGAAGTVLEPTPVAQKQKILNALNQLQAGGSTAGAQGIKLAYQLAESSFKKDAVNRIILATDGDFNVGITNRDELKGYVERKREKGIFLSVLGFGAGNYHDQLMQQLAQNGNGVAAYIDTLSEAQKVLVNEASSTLFPIAKDVKIQVEFNPATVAEYRLLGYETRKLNREDFNNDAVDAGEIGAGHSVTAIYEITPAGSAAQLIDQSRYATPATQGDKNSEYGFLKMRYKLPEENQSKLITQAIPAQLSEDSAVSGEANFAIAVAGFAQLLKDGKHTGDWHFDDAIALAQAHKGSDDYGYRTEFIQLIRKAKIAQGM